MKCVTPAYLGDFNISGAVLRKKGMFSSTSSSSSSSSSSFFQKLVRNCKKFHVIPPFILLSILFLINKFNSFVFPTPKQVSIVLVTP
jgi:hypothetical protein